MRWSTLSFMISTACLLTEFFVNSISKNVVFADGSIYAFFNVFNFGVHFEATRYSQFYFQLLPVLFLNVFGYVGLDVLNIVYAISIFISKFSLLLWVFWASKRLRDSALMPLFSLGLMISSFTASYMFGLVIETTLLVWVLCIGILNFNKLPFNSVFIIIAGLLLAFGYEFNFLFILGAIAIWLFVHKLERIKFLLFLIGCGSLSLFRFFLVRNSDVEKTLEFITGKSLSAVMATSFLIVLCAICAMVLKSLRRPLSVLLVLLSLYLGFEVWTANSLDASAAIFSPWMAMSYRLEILALASLPVLIYALIKITSKSVAFQTAVTPLGLGAVFFCFLIIITLPQTRMRDGRHLLQQIIQKDQACLDLTKSQRQALVRGGIGEWTLPYVAILVQGSEPRTVINFLKNDFGNFKNEGICNQLKTGFLRNANQARIFLKDSKGFNFSPLISELNQE